MSKFLTVAVVTVVLLFPVSVDAASCGNGVCQSSGKKDPESCSVCPQDCGSCGGNPPTPTPVPTTTPTPSPSSPVPTPPPEPTPTLIPTSSPTSLPTSTPNPTLTPTSSPTPSSPILNESTISPSPLSANQAITTDENTSTLYPFLTLTALFNNPTNQTPSYTGTAQVEQGSIASVEYSYDEGSQWFPAEAVDGTFNASQEKYSFALSVAEGLYSILVRAITVNGTVSPNFARSQFTLITSPPTITLDPFSTEINKTTVTLSGEISMKLGQVRAVDISLDEGRSWKPAIVTNNRFALELSNLEDNNYTVIARAFDNAGNTGTSNPQTLVVDTIPPIIGGSSHYNQSHALQAVNKIVAGQPSEIITSMKGGVTNARITSGELTFPLEPVEGTHLWKGTLVFPESGTFNLSITAEDGAGNITEQPIHTVTVAAAGVVRDISTNEPIPGAEITVYYFDEDSSTWREWDSVAFGQKNPFQTSELGEYSLSLPQGKYYFNLAASGFNTTQINIFTVTEPTNITFDLFLEPATTINLFHTSLVENTITVDSANSELLVDSKLPTTRLTPILELPTLSDYAIDPSTIPGKKVLVTFLSSWSESAQEQAAILSQLQEELPPDTVMLAVAVQDTETIAKLFMKRGRYQFPFAVDQSGSTTQLYQAAAVLPYHIVFNAQGEPTQMISGVRSKTELVETLNSIP